MDPDQPTDPRLDVVADSIELGAGRIAFVRPRDAAALRYEDDGADNAAADAAYPPHWAELWPSGVELARAVSERSWSGAAVVELGCGLGLPAIAAALGGARVLATDRSPDAVTFAAVNAEQNGVVVDTAVCAWDEPGALVERGPWDLVLAADVLYGQRNVDDLLALLPRLVGARGAVWIADPRRPLTDEFLGAARERWRSVGTVAGRDPDVDIHRFSGPRSR